VGEWINEQREMEQWRWYHKLAVVLGVTYLVALTVIGLVAFSFPG